jgi:outer membrane protein assembly factor BamB/enterochelin esterase-like enzyme
VVSVFLCTAQALAAPAAGDWPAFRGPDGDGAARADGVFDSGGCGLSVAWKQPLGSGYSGMAVADGRVLTMFSDGTSDLVIALDENSGRELWRHVMAPTYKGHDGSHDGPIATPLIAGGRVFCLDPRGEWVGLDLASGQMLWSANVETDHQVKQPHYGFGSSPVTMDGVVVLQIGAEDGQVFGFDPASGSKLWSAGRDRFNYQAPIPYEINGRRQLLAAGGQKLQGIDPKSGELLWEYEHGGGGPGGWAAMVPVAAGSGRLFLNYKAEGSTAIELTGGEAVSFKTLWEDSSIRNSYNVPVYHDGHIYGYSARFLTCVDAASGQSRWRSRQPGDGFMVLVDGHLVLATKEGGIHVVRAAPDEYREVAALPGVFDDLVWSLPSFANGHIFARTLSEIARIDVRAASATASRPALAADDGLAATAFGRFLKELENAADKPAAIDRFMAGREFPVVEGEWVHFVYRGPGEDLAVGGDVIGARQDRPMRRVPGTDFFHFSMKVEPDTRSNYVFIRDYQEMVDPLNPRRTSTTIIGKDMEMSFSGEAMEMSWFAMPGWTPPAHLDEPDPAHRGRIENQELTSNILKEKRRPGTAGDEAAQDDAAKGADSAAAVYEDVPVKHTIDVYLPEGYDAGTQRYPVAYIFGGEEALEQGKLPTMLDNLCGRRVRPLIAVFIHRQPGFFGDPSEYMRMFSEELVPFVDSRYRTIAEPGARACVGMGFGGYSAFMAAFSGTTVGNYGGQGSFVMDSMEGPLAAMVKGPAEQPMRIYLDWGKYDLRNPHENWDLGASNRRLAAMLTSKGYSVAGGEAHDGCDWSSWRNRTDDLFEALFPL